MNYIRLIFVSGILILCSQISLAQKMKFTGDSAYLTELRTFMGYDKEKDQTPVFNQFSSKWTGGQLNEAQKKKIVQVSNNLLQKRAKPNPHFINFLRYMNSVLNSQSISGEFGFWLDIIEKFSLSTEFGMTSMDKLMDNLAIFNDSSMLFLDKSNYWKHNSNQYKIGFADAKTVRIQISKTDLICYSKRDSSIIRNTSGYYYPLTDQWIGTAGNVGWERAGFSRDSVYANLKNYRIDLKFSDYKADSVEFVNKRYLKAKLTGRLEEKILANITPEKATYPKFFSYEKKVDIARIVPNIDYSGGFTMEGAKMVGSGQPDAKAELYIYKGKDVFAKLSALYCTFGKTNIIVNNARMLIYIDQDSIWHPGLNFNYLIQDEKVSLTRSVDKIYKSKFYDSYHKLEIDVEEISFGLKDSLILFKSPPGTTFRKAIFQSSNYFSKDDYDEVRMRDNFHPLEKIKAIAPSTECEFKVSDLAHFLGIEMDNARDMIARLSDMGFLNYESEKRIIPEQKLFDYISSNYGKKDYDAIQIISEPDKGNNAELNLKSNDLNVHGIQNFVLSDNRRVGVIPENSTIRIKKDLDIDFDGKLQAGLAWLIGKNMTLHYDSFIVSFQKLDSITFTYRSEKKRRDSTYSFTPVESTIDSITGLLRIDNPINKSGKKKYPRFPILESHKNSFVYYDKNNNKDEAYKKEKFYVENYPFVIDSLNTITAKNISFTGNLNSGGVFPRFDEKLVVRQDNSLGFIHGADSAGVAIYDSLARYFNVLSLDNSGLKGAGFLKYLNSTVYASKFNFYPDSMNTYASHIDMLKQDSLALGTKYPQVNADSLYVFWIPKQDTMFMTNLNKPFSAFEEKAELSGKLKLNTKGLEGNGTLQISDAKLDSKSYSFFDESFMAKSADFILQPVKGEKSPFLTYNVKADVDFDKKLGIFKSNGKNSYIDLPVNQFRCYMNYFSWHMGINQIDIGTTRSVITDSIPDIAQADSLVNLNEDNGILASFTDTSYTAEELAAGSKFISTHPNQDSLSFIASSSSYNMKKYIIKAKGVKFINVADAVIFPASSIIILPDANLQQLEHSRILADRNTSYHKFYDASIKILGQKNYMASADYEYVDRLDSVQNIHFKSISVSPEKYTIARGEIKESDLFNLSPEFTYSGKTILKAPIKNIEFDGATKINHECKQRLPVYWLKFDAVINPDSVIIPLSNTILDRDLRLLQAGIFLTSDSLGIYPGFLTKKYQEKDIPVLNARGLLYYNVKTGYYEIADSSKLQHPEMEGNYISLHKKLCISLNEGKLNLGADFGQVKVNPVGFMRYNLDSWEVNLDIMMGVDFFFSDAALTEMAKTINDNYTLGPIITTSISYQRSLKELIGLNNSKTLMQELALNGGFSSVPSEMNNSIFFSDLKMKWNNKQKAWQSDGKIGVGNIKGNPINKMLDGIVEVKKTRTGDILNIYLEVNPKTWYFFTYTRGTMKSISSDNNYNNIVSNLKDKYRKSPVKDDENPYMFFPSTDRAKEIFVEEIKKQKIAAESEKDINLDNRFNVVNPENTETESTENDDLENDSTNTDTPIIEVEEIDNDHKTIDKKENVQKNDTIQTNGDKKVQEIKLDENNKIKTETNKTDEKVKKGDPKKEEEETEDVKYEEEEEEGEGPGW